MVYLNTCTVKSCKHTNEVIYIISVLSTIIVVYQLPNIHFEYNIIKDKDDYQELYINHILKYYSQL